jgi:hypothetical protein
MVWSTNGGPAPLSRAAVFFARRLSRTASLADSLANR